MNFLRFQTTPDDVTKLGAVAAGGIPQPKVPAQTTVPAVPGDQNPLIPVTGSSPAAVITAPPAPVVPPTPATPPVTGTPPTPPSTEITPKPTPPAGTPPIVPNQSAQFTKLYTDWGVAGMQAQLNSLAEQKAAAADALANFKLTEQAKGGESESEYTSRIGEAERMAMARSDFYDRQMQQLNNRLTTANTYIKEVMDLTNTDYTNAAKQWNDNYANYLSSQKEYDSQATQEQQNASAYLNSVSKMLSDSGKGWNDVSAAMKATIALEETKAGWAPGTLEAFSTSKPKAQVIATTLMPDGVSQSIVSRDPNTGAMSVTIVSPASGTVVGTPTTGPGSINLYGIKSTATTTGFGGVSGTVTAEDGGTFLSSQGPEADKAVAQKLLTSDTYKDLTVTEAMKLWSNSGYDGTDIAGVDPQAKIGDLPQDQIDKVLDYIKSKEGIGGSAQPSANQIAANWNPNDASLPPPGDAGNGNVYWTDPQSGVKISTGRTANNIFQSAMTLALDESATPQKFLGGLSGSKGQGAALKNAISNKSAALIVAAGVDQATLQAQWKANKTALTQQVTYLNNTQRAYNTANSTLDALTKWMSDNGVDPTQFPDINTFINFLNAKGIDPGQAGGYYAQLTTLRQEYSQVLARGGQRTDATDAQAASLIPQGLTPAQLSTVADRIKVDANNVMNSSIAQVNNITTGGEGADQVAKFLAYTHGVKGTTGGNAPLVPNSSVMYQGKTYTVSADGTQLIPQ